MPIAARFASALIALTCGGAALSTDARADPPLPGLPYLYDAANKPIGPYFPSTDGVNAVLATINGRFVSLPASTLGIRGGRDYTLYYKKPDCAGGAFMLGNTMPYAGITGDVLFYPALARETTKMKSQHIYYPTGHSSGCQPTSYEALFSKATTAKISDLGFTAPFELRPFGPN